MSDEQQSEFNDAISLLASEPQNDEVWDRVEILAGDLDNPEAVAAAYKDCLSKDMESDEAVTLGKRAAHFHEEWFGDDREGLATLLSRVIELSPKNEWAMQRLTYVLTVSERWDDVIALYQGFIKQTTDKTRLVKLLDEAFQVTKDLANRPDLAIDFLKAKLEIEASPKQLVALERLLERHERWLDLISLWRDALPQLSEDKRRDSLARIAKTYFEKLGNAPDSLESLREIFIDHVGHKDALQTLEKLATAESVEATLRNAALTTVREVYERAERPTETVRVLGEVLPLSDEQERMLLHKELGERLSELEEHAASHDHYAALLILDASSDATQRSLRKEAQFTKNFEHYATALAAAAESAADTDRRVSLLSDAALALVEFTDNEPKAIELLQSALALDGISSGDVLTLGNRLNTLLARAKRPSERLEVLQRLADAETVDSSHKAFVGDVALLAAELGNVDCAIDAWRSRLSEDAGDLRALEALAELLRKEERWEELVVALRARLEQAVPDNQKRADLIQIAGIHEEKLGQQEEALQAWTEVKEGYGDDPRVIAAMTRLMTILKKWEQLTALLEVANAQQVDYLAEQFASLGTAYQQSLGDELKSIECYRRALAIDVAHTGARDGLRELLDNEATQSAAAEALVHSLRTNGDLLGLLDIVEARLAGTEDERKHSEILREAALIAEEQAKDNAKALAFLTRLFPLEPRDQVLEDHMVALAKEADDWKGCLDAFAGAQAAIAEDAYSVAQMLYREALVREEYANDKAGALDCCIQVIGEFPDHEAAVTSAIRLAGPENRFAAMIKAALDFGRERNTVPKPLLATIAEFAETNHSWERFCESLLSYIPQSEISKRHQAELYYSVAEYQVDKLEDNSAAIASLLKSIKLDPDRVDTHCLLADLQNESPDITLYRTLRRLCEIESGQLQHFVDSAELAIEELDQKEQEESLKALQARATSAWRGSAPATSETAPQELVSWAVEKLSQHYIGSNQAQRALDLLVAASRLPFPAETCLRMRNRAAEIAADVLKDTGSAIDMYRAILTLAPDDRDALEKLAELYTKEKRLPELLALRRQELSIESDPDLAVTMRLGISMLIDQIDRIGGRYELLRANLRYCPGHRLTIDAVSSLLSSTGNHAKLTEILEKQAELLESDSQLRRAAQLWEQSARIAEEDLRSPDMAISAYRKVANLAPNLDALDSLARLYIDRGQSAAAVPWLAQAIPLADEASKPSFVIRLAEAHMAAKQPVEAIEALSAACDTSEKPLLEIRNLRLSLLRETEDWLAFANALSTTLPFVDASDKVEQLATEAASVYHNKLETPAAAVPALEQALQIVPDSRSLRLLLATSQRAAGNLDSARDILTKLVEDYGRRRSKERAAVHVELAQVAKADADLDLAMSELGLASKMDPANAHILRALAELAREQGDLDQAERSLAALLLSVRRQKPLAGDDSGELSIGISEVLFELHHIAAIRDDQEKAKELLESVSEAASANDDEVFRLRRTLVEHKEFRYLETVLRARVALSQDAQAKAKLLSYVADLLVGPLNDTHAGFKARLECLDVLPVSEYMHVAARDLAQTLNKSEVYLNKVEELVGGQRRLEESEHAAQLQMRAGTIAEQDLKDLSRASDFYRAAEESMTSPVDALFALARVSAAAGNIEEQTRALDALTSLALQDGTVVGQADALYRLAELQVVESELIERGIALLQKAIELEPRYRQAALTLQTAANTSDNDAKVLMQYEKAARSSNDDVILLDYLQRVTSSSSASDKTALFQEAVSLATTLNLHEQATELLENAVTSARTSDQGLSSAIWAALQLSEVYAASGKFDDAQALLVEMAEIAPKTKVTELASKIVDACINADNSSKAAEVLEFLQQREPSNAEFWKPLLALLVNMGEGPRVTALVDATLPTLTEAKDRNILRLEKGRYLIEQSQDEEAIALLRDACLDDPDNTDVAEMLEGILRKEGNEEALSDFLWQRFNEAKERKNKENVAHIACRLGDLLEKLGREALTVYSEALNIAPANPELLRNVLSRLEADSSPLARADLSERLLRVESPERASSLALLLVEMREALGDESGVRRALEIGQRICPTHEPIRVRLENWYLSQESWGPLAEMKCAIAVATDDAESKVLLFRQAAAIYREHLVDMPLCLATLHRAQDAAPADGILAHELATVHASVNEFEEGIDALTKCIEIDPGNELLMLLLLRAELLQKTGQFAVALDNLEDALDLNRPHVEPLLLQALEEARTSASSDGNRELEHSATMRLVELFHSRGSEEDARNILFDWIQADSDDVVALRKLRDMDRKNQRWDGVVTATTHLVRLEEGEEQVRNALILADAADQIGAIDHGRGGLQLVHHAQPDNRDIRDRLRTLYQVQGEYKELADLLVVDAEWSDDNDTKYENFRAAAALYINELNDPAAAVAPAQQAKELRPNDNATVLLLVDVLISSEQYDDATAMLEPAIAGHKRRSPELASLQQRMSKVAGAQGDQEAQLGWLKKSFDCNRKDGEIASELAHLATELGNYELALKPLRSITLMDNPSPVSRVMALLWEAKIEQARDNRAKAAMLAKKALREDPDYTEAEQFLETLAEQ